MTHDWKAHANMAERRLRRHMRQWGSERLLSREMAQAALCGAGISAWCDATGTSERLLSVEEVVSRTLDARPRPETEASHIQHERQLAEWCGWCKDLDEWLVSLKRLGRTEWMRLLVRSERQHMSGRELIPRRRPVMSP